MPGHPPPPFGHLPLRGRRDPSPPQGEVSANPTEGGRPGADEVGKVAQTGSRIAGVLHLRHFPSAVFALLLAASPASAHDFWLQPRGWQAKPGVALPTTVEVGHGPFRQQWGGTAERLVELRDFAAGGVTDRRGGFRPSADGVNLAPVFAQPGLHVLTLVTSLAQSELPSIRFNDYATVEGLTPALAARARSGTSGKPGRELYSRRCKALIQVGAPSVGDARIATRVIGHSLEIVPLISPYALGADRQLPVRVLYEGRPLTGALVKLTNLEFDAKPLATMRTDARGEARLRVPPVGSWLVNVIWTKPIVNPRADFETTFASLTFGYSAGGRGR